MSLRSQQKKSASPRTYNKQLGMDFRYMPPPTTTTHRPSWTCWADLVASKDEELLVLFKKGGEDEETKEWTPSEDEGEEDGYFFGSHRISPLPVGANNPRHSRPSRLNQ